MFHDYRRVTSLGGLVLVLLCGCGSDDTPPDNAAGRGGGGANAGGGGGSGTNAGGGGASGTNTSGSAGATPAAAGTAGASADPCVLAITMRDCCWAHVAARQSQVDDDPCIAQHPLAAGSIPRDLDLECRAAQMPACDPEMGVCALGFFPPPTAAREAEDGTCVLTG
jgi:hypothetical protein